jgi:hypothetical protein
MPDRPRTGDAGEGPTTNTSALLGVMLAAVLAFLLIFGARMFNFSETRVDLSTTQPGIQTPVTSDNKKP